MTVLPRWRQLEPTQQARRARRDDPEPALAELLDDPVLHILMARDGVDRQALDSVIADARRKLNLVAQSPFELTLFAECRAA